MDNYQTLFNRSKKIKLLESISHLLHWDQETYMPKEGSQVRPLHIEMLASLIHKERTSASFTHLLEKVAEDNLTESQKAAVREWKRDYRLAKALPHRFVREFAKITTEAIPIWTRARVENSFSLFAPYLKKIVKMCQKKAAYLGYQRHPYDALLDFYEPEMTTETLDSLFDTIKRGIAPLLSSILNAPDIDARFLHGKFPREKILQFSHLILEKMGYDFTRGRLDLSTHPFSTTLHPSDSRITTRIDTDNLFDCFGCVLHEGGHSLYEMGMDAEHYGSPLCEAVSHGLHESQSRLWETLVGQSKPFWSYFLPHLQENFPQLSSVSLDGLYRAINKVIPSFIRVEADEVTYPLHVILRYELEKKLMDGTLPVEEIPNAWNTLMQNYLGITPTNDAQGCLQDIHWSFGGIGYFPTYVLGNLYAAQFFSAFEKANPHCQERVEKGDLIFLREWLREKIHRFGKFYRAADLVKEVSGEPLSEKFYLNYLNQKYATMYNFQIE